MDPTPLVSVIVPVYNVERYLPASVGSLLNQTYSNIEIILVDDGSTDTSGALCDAFVRSDDYDRSKISVVCIHQENQGVSAARNAGFARSTGEYVTFVDDDDIVAPTMIEEMVSLAQRHDADCVGCSCRTFHDESELAAYARVDAGETQIVSGAEALHLLYTGLVLCFVRTAWGFLYKKSLLPTDCPVFPVGKYHEDEFTVHKLLYPLETVVVYPKPLYFYRQRENSITDNNFKMIQMDKIEAGFGQADYFHEANETFLEELATSVALERCIRFWDRVQRSEEFRATAAPLIEEIYDTRYQKAKEHGLDLGYFAGLFELFSRDCNAAIVAAKAAATSYSMSFEEANFTTLAPATIRDVRLDPFAALMDLFLADPQRATAITNTFMVDAVPGFPLDSLIGAIDEPNRPPAPRRSLVSRIIRRLFR